MEEKNTEEILTENTETEETVHTEAEETEEAKKEKKPSKKETEHKLLSEIEELKAKLKEKEESHLRMAAEYDNFRRRSREEKDALYELATAETVAEFLQITDNLERAALYDDAEKVKEGLVLIAKSVDAVFSKLGIESVGKVGDKFDPKLHNAIMHIEDEAYGENEIVEVFQKGYKKGNKIIRFAMVKTIN